AVDGELYRLRKQQEEKPKELEQAEALLAAQEQRVKEVEAQVTTLQLAQKEKEGELQSQEASVKKLQAQLFQLKTNKEYAAMQREIETLKADNSLLEETVIRTLEAIDQASQERQRHQRQFADAQQRFRQERERLERELASIGEHMAQLERNRQALAPGVPPGALSLYERVLHIREGLALVPLLDDSCGGCHRRLPPQVINQVYLKAALVTCESCNRILYFDEAHSKL
ncbi:MAG: hypothetical protein HYZ91_05055, partial [Candidatus Omnitrophica bacterium]|nr:hypothetical protein [Candidatus Omnitrophota bacterium]